MNKIPDAYLQNYDGYGDDWISTSSLALLQMCGIAWEFKYALRVKEGVTVRLAAGSAAHKARQVNLVQKVDSRIDLAAEEVTDAARDAANEKLQDGEIMPEEEYDGKSDADVRGVAVDMAVGFAGVDYEAFQKGIVPAAAEESMAVRYKELGKLIVGTVDVREEGWIIDDLKTGKSRKGQKFADTSQGLTTYGLLTWITHKHLPAKYKIQNVVALKKGIVTETYETTRTDQDMQRQLDRFAAAVQVIEKGAFVPCSPEHWKCSRAFCGYWWMCKYGGAK